MAKSKSKSRPETGRTSSRRVGLATVALAIVTLAATGAVLWLTLSADTTMARLRANADRQSLHAVIDLPAPSGDGSQTAEAVPMAPERSAPTPELVEELGQPLPPAPVAELVQVSAIGPLPRIAVDGRTPWQTYARPFDTADTRPRIAIVITDMGHAHAPTNAAIQRLPGSVTLAFTPYAPDLDAWLIAARERGHETLMMMPMEPDTYPRDDPGPHTLLTSLGPDANRDRLEWVLSRGAGYVGVVTEMGSRFTASEEALSPVLDALGKRGLLVLDNRTAENSRVGDLAVQFGLPQAANSRLIDSQTDRDSIDLRLQELEDLARENGFAVGLAHPYPLTFERLAAWIPTLERKGIVLAPITAVVSRPTTG